MKGTIASIAFSILLFMAACSGPTGSSADSTPLTDTANYTTIQWLDSIVGFGTIQQGEQISLKFRFRNTGKKPLFVVHVRASCGCTVPEYTKEAVPPGGEGAITAAFDTNRSAAGNIRKTVTVYTNTSNGSEHTLIFTGDVNEVKVNQ